MATINSTLNSIAEDSALKMVAQTYSEVAVSKLQRIRERIETNRKFVDDIAQLYYLVRTMAPTGADPRQGKTGAISLLLTSNARFYGDLEEQLIKLYVSHTPEFPTDRAVVGKTGNEYLRGIKYVYSVNDLGFKEDLPTQTELTSLVEKIKNYQRIFIYHCKFQTVLVQQPTFSDITGSPALSSEAGRQAFYYIFEPEVDKMLKFIDEQVVTLLIEQAFLEAELARTAARLVSMEQAQTNADILLKDQRKILARSRRQLDNVRLVEMVIKLQAQVA